MTKRENPDMATMIAGALDWWRDAGLDHDYVDEPTHWNKPENTPENDLSSGPTDATSSPKKKPETSPKPAKPENLIDVSALPNDLTEFTQWWLTEPKLAEGPPALRVPPRGQHGAELMVMVPEPESQDKASLLSGPQGKLLSAMITAFGIKPENTYIASAVPRHLPAADWKEMERAGLGKVLQHHIALAAPKKLLILGASVLSLIESDPPKGPADLRRYEHQDMNVPLLACSSLSALLEQPRWKARVWQAWLESTR